MLSVGGKESISSLGELSRKIEDAEENEACHWRQRAKVEWLTFGDRNSRFFHTCASKRRRRNFISMLDDGSGNMKMKKEEKLQIITSFFKGLFTSSKPSKEAIEAATAKVKARVRSEELQILDRPFEELSDMHPTKAPGPNGFNAGFYQRFWQELGEEVTKEVLTVLNEGGEVKD